MTEWLEKLKANLERLLYVITAIMVLIYTTLENWTEFFRAWLM